MWQFIRSRSLLSILILINVGVWITLAITDTTVYLSTIFFNDGIRLKPFFHYYLGYHADYTHSLFHPWTLLTSLFVHDSFWHLLFNMLVLGIAGRIYRQYMSEKSLLIHYIAGGVCGNLMFQAAYNLFPALRSVSAFSYIFGASAAVLAILVAITIYRPNHPVGMMLFGQIRLKWLTLILIGFMLIPNMDSEFKNLGGQFAHLGGALYGAAVALWLLKVRGAPTRHSHKNEEEYYTPYETITPEPAAPSSDSNDEKKVEEILAKISKNGYGALTTEEKDFLYHYKKS